MSKAKEVRGINDEVIGHAIMCPACGTYHVFDDKVNSARAKMRGGGWDFNGDVDRPTFSPSMLMRTNFDIAAFSRAEKAGRALPVDMPKIDYVCHSYVREGRIEFLGDCTHDMRGQTHELPDIKRL